VKPLSRVAIVEDEPDTLARLSAAVRADARLVLVATWSTSAQAIAALQDPSMAIDALLVDLGLPDAPGTDVIRVCRTASPSTEVLVITMFADEANVLRALAAGAHGYLLKDGTLDDLSAHVQHLMAGGSPMSPIVARQLLARMHFGPTLDQVAATQAMDNARRASEAGLTEREHEVLGLIARGYTYAETAKLLGIGETTVRTHVRHIYEKLAVTNKAEAIYEAQQMGLLRHPT
jgi:DNA-binding NarL/FixJ family response regulator